MESPFRQKLLSEHVEGCAKVSGEWGGGVDVMCPSWTGQAAIAVGAWALRRAVLPASRRGVGASARLREPWAAANLEKSVGEGAVRRLYAEPRS